MQVSPLNSAAAAAGVTAQSNTKDASAAPQAGSASQANNLNVEKTGEANPDRDAQGQGDGLPGDHRQAHNSDDESEDVGVDGHRLRAPGLASLPGEEPCQLDITG